MHIIIASECAECVQCVNNLLLQLALKVNFKPPIKNQNHCIFNSCLQLIFVHRLNFRVLLKRKRKITFHNAIDILTENCYFIEFKFHHSASNV